MMKHGCCIMANIGLISLCALLLFSGVVQAQELSDLTVENGAICEDVVDHEAVGASTSFPAGVSKLYCLTRITGAKEQTQIAHIWYYGEIQRARVELAVKSPNWRTYSSKRIQSHETGQWHVEVVDKEGRILETYRFDIY